MRNSLESSLIAIFPVLYFYCPVRDNSSYCFRKNLQIICTTVNIKNFPNHLIGLVCYRISVYEYFITINNNEVHGSTLPSIFLTTSS